MRRNIAIGIVTYNPNDNLIDRLKSAVENGYAVYVFDNSPEFSRVRDFCQTSPSSLIKYMTLGKNLGLGVGISGVCAQAYYESYKALIFFDQDTVFHPATLEFVEKYYLDNPQCAASYSAIVFNAKKISMLREVIFAISSGSLFFLENVKKINFHNENYFVDYVDYEFCFRSIKHHLKIGECSMAPGFDHQSEQPDAVYNIFGKHLLLRKYSNMRMLDTLKGSLRLMKDALLNLNFIYFRATFKSFCAYYFWQILVRAILLFNPKSE